MTDITPQLALWIQQLRAIAQTGIAFDPPTYDRERYEALLELAATMAATMNASAAFDPQLANEFAARWRADILPDVHGYVTPKVGIGAIVFNAHDELLMIERPEGGWFYPTGWADIGFAPAQVAAKEVREETGLLVTPQRVIGLYDSAKWRGDTNLHFYSIVFDCRLDGGELHRHPLETRDVGFFARDRLPQPIFQNRDELIERAWDAHGDARAETYFDR